MRPWAIRSADVRPAGVGAALASATVARSGAAAREGGGAVLALAVPAGSTGVLCSLMATLLPLYRRAPYPLQPDQADGTAWKTRPSGCTTKSCASGLNLMASSSIGADRRQQRRVRPSGRRVAHPAVGADDGVRVQRVRPRWPRAQDVQHPDAAGDQGVRDQPPVAVPRDCCGAHQRSEAPMRPLDLLLQSPPEG